MTCLVLVERQRDLVLAGAQHLPGERLDLEGMRGTVGRRHRLRLEICGDGGARDPGNEKRGYEFLDPAPAEP